MLKTMRIIQQAAPMPAIKAGCLTTSEICWDRWSSWITVSVIRPDASEDKERGNDLRCESMIRKDTGVFGGTNLK